MTTSLRLIAAVALAVMLPLAAQADPQKKQGAPAARPAAPAAAPHPAAPAAVARPAAPAFHPPAAVARPAPSAAPRSAPSFARQAPSFHPHAAARPSVAQRPSFSRHAAPNVQRSRPVLSGSPATAAPRALTRAQQVRQERIARRQDLRQVRSLPPSQRAQALRNLRQERLQQQQQATTNAQKQPAVTNAQKQPAITNVQKQPAATNAQTNAQKQAATSSQNLTTQSIRTQRRNGAPLVTPQQAQQGRFAALANNPAAQATALAAPSRQWALRRAWSLGVLAGFVPWYGPVFWPYAYGDIFYFAFWPYAYDPGFWFYAYDDLFDVVFWVDAGPYPDYAYAEPYYEPYYEEGYGYRRRRPYSGRPYSARPSGGSVPRVSTAAIRELCGDPGSGITAWPFREIERTVQPTPEQQRLLDGLKQAASQAASDFKASCPAATATPMTPPGRLQSMLNRLDAILDAVNSVRPPLEAFYNSLSDEQKARFNRIGPAVGRERTTRQATNEPMGQQAANCGGQKAGLTSFPIQRIEEAVNPSDAQQRKLDRLEQATNKAVEILQGACPTETPQTPVGRLAAMQQRLSAMIEAGKSVRPALEDFYASLNNEQKARFNTLSRNTKNNG